MNPLKVTASRDIYQAGSFRVVEEQVLHPTGKTHTHVTLKHNGAVVVIPQLEDGSFLLVNQYRHSVGGELLEFPAGTLGKNEEPLDCAKREIQEEVGHAASEWIGLGELYPTPGFCDELQHLYLARGLRESRAAMDEDEIIQVVRMSLPEVEESIKNGRLKDGKSLAAFCRGRLLGLF